MLKRVKFWTGPSTVALFAEKARGAGLIDVVAGTEHVYVTVECGGDPGAAAWNVLAQLQKTYGQDWGLRPEECYQHMEHLSRVPSPWRRTRMTNEFYATFPQLWTLGAQAIADGTGEPVVPTVPFKIPSSWWAPLHEAQQTLDGPVWARLTRDARQEFVCGDQRIQRRLVRQHPALRPLAQVLDASFEGPLSPAFGA